MDEAKIEIKAIRYAEEFYAKLGWKVLNVARVRGSHSGYDLFLEKGRREAHCRGERLFAALPNT